MTDETLASKTILYIEDTESNLRLVARILAMRPQVVLLTAVTGADGIAMAQQRQPDLVLLDMHLPDTDGIDVLRALRTDPATADIRIAVLSADAISQRIDDAILGGAAEYITKPFSVASFLDKIDQLLAL